MDFKEEYRIQADKHQIDDEVLGKTINRLKEIKSPRRHFTLKTISIAAALIVCMGVTVFAYEYHKYKLTNVNAGRSHEYANNEEGNVQEVNQTATAENINVTIKHVTGDAYNMYVLVELKTTDGSDLNVNTETDITILERQKFENAYFVVDGTNVKFQVGFRVDDGSDSTTALIELIHYNDADSSILLENLNGKEIQIVLENYQYEVLSNDSIGFTYSDIGTMLEEVGMAESTEYSDIGTFLTFANGTRVPSYSLNAGSKKIYFSEKYPETYIDNIGIYEYGETYIKQLYVSIVPENDAVKEELLSNLSLLNKETGNYIIANQPYIGDSDGGYRTIKNADGTTTDVGKDDKMVQPDDGRIVLIYNAGEDIYDETTESYVVDTTTEILKDFNFVLKTTDVTNTVNHKWTFDFTLDNFGTTLIYDKNQAIQKDGVNAIIDKIEVSDTYLKIEGNADTTFSLKFRGTISLILKDGSSIDIGQKVGGSYEQSTGKFNIEGILETLVDADDVVAIELWNQTINLK